jgi:quinoprotein glucose dehydrogenase
MSLFHPPAGAMGLLAGAALAVLAPSALAAPGDWPTANHDPGGARYSPLAQITPANIGKLRQAWVYHMKPAGSAAAAATALDRQQAEAEGVGGPGRPPGGPPGAGGPPPGGGEFPGFRGTGGFSASEGTPLVVGGRMFVATPYGRIVALDLTAGKELWSFDLPVGDQAATRGMEYWPGDGKAAPTVVFGTRAGRLMSLAAATGKPAAGFGDNGVVPLKTPEVMVTGMNKAYGLSSPPIVFKNLIITGANNGEGVGGAIGDTRAWDARTGELVWTFHSVPQPGEPGYGSWEGDSGKNRAGVNVWGMMSLDARRGIAFLPFGAPAWDRYGGDRPGDDLFSTAVVAVDAATGRHLWHFQVTHHDIWDYDTESAPTLFDVKRGGKTIPAVGITSKAGLLFILDRRTGKPIYGVEERPVPKSDVPEERASPTPPVPLKPAPLGRETMTRADLAKVTPELEAFCKKLVEDNNIDLGGPYLPTHLNRVTVNFPGTLGGVNWAGGAVDPKLGYYVVNVLNFGQLRTLVPIQGGALPYAERGPVSGRFWNNATRQPCNAPPWGELVAVNVNTGDIAWRSVLGVTDNLPEGKQATGRPSIGGPTTTAGGLTFIAATDDSRIRAFDTRTGKEVWTARLPASAHTNPISYADAKGKQYVAIVATGGSFLASPVVSDSVVVFALP